MTSKVEIPSAKDLVAERLRRLIYSEELSAGETVSLKALAQTFQVSTTPIRDALFQLEMEGLVKINPRVGVTVREIDFDEILDVYRMKAQLQPIMVQLAIERSTQEECRDFAESLTILQAAYESGDAELYITAFETRRAILQELARSAVLADTLRLIDGRIRMFRFRNLHGGDRRKRSLEVQRRIAAAVLAKDALAGFQIESAATAERVTELLTQREVSA